MAKRASTCGASTACEPNTSSKCKRTKNSRWNNLNAQGATSEMNSEVALPTSETDRLENSDVHVRPDIDPVSEKIYELVQSHQNEGGPPPLHEAVRQCEVQVATYFVSGGLDVHARDKNDATPFDLATNKACRDLLKHHAAVFAAVEADPSALISALVAHCSALSGSNKPSSETALSLRPYHLIWRFSWTPPSTQAVVFKWARDAFIVQLAAFTPPILELPDDCAGD